MINQRILIACGILCAIIGIICLFSHAYAFVMYFSLIGAVLGFMGGAIAWDTSRPLVIRQVDESIKKELDKSK